MFALQAVCVCIYIYDAYIYICMYISYVYTRRAIGMFALEALNTDDYVYMYIYIHTHVCMYTAATISARRY